MNVQRPRAKVPGGAGKESKMHVALKLLSECSKYAFTREIEPDTSQT